MVHGHHLIISAYGFWLPNDPRGSWSDFVRAWEIAKFGEATKVETRRSVAAVPHDRRLRKAAKEALKYPAVEFTGLQALSVGNGFARYQSAQGRQAKAVLVVCDAVYGVVALITSGRKGTSVGGDARLRLAAKRAKGALRV